MKQRRAFCAHSLPNSPSSFVPSYSLSPTLRESSKCSLMTLNRAELASRSRIVSFASSPTLYRCRHSASLLGKRHLSTSGQDSITDRTEVPATDSEKWSRLLHRTNLCGELKEADEGKEVNLCGWLTAVRDIGDHIFLVINDHTGSVQITLDTPLRTARLTEVNSWQLETVLNIKGSIKKRPDGMKNPLMKTGTIEVWASEITFLNPVTVSTGLPFTSFKPIPQLQMLSQLQQQSESSDQPAFKKPADSVYALASEELRLKYRFLDLRRDQLQRNLRLRSAVTLSVRNHLQSIEERFVEIETPTLFRSTPEGAREFLVPTRVKGKFYSLPQSPQQYKQLLMAGGFDRYFQFARCYRDEGLRSDRQPEFTQIDLEMAFVTPADVRGTVERLLKAVWRASAEFKLTESSSSSSPLGNSSKDNAKEKAIQQLMPPQLREGAGAFPIMTYQEAMENYGSDKPDLRFGMKLQDVTHIFNDSNVGVLKSALEADAKTKSVGGGCIKAINFKGMADLSREESEAIQSKARDLGAKGVIEIKVRGDKWKSPIDKYLSATEREQLVSAMGIEDGDLIVLSADPNREKACQVLGGVRLLGATQMKKKGKLVIPEEDAFKFLWVEDFPLFTPVFAEDRKNGGKFILETTHHPFTAPWPEDVAALQRLVDKVDKEKGGVAEFDSIAEIGQIPRGLHYDCVVNGVELGGGSIRIHSEPMQRAVFRCLGMSEGVMSRFSHLLEALGMGCPPHGGLAVGFDRLMAVMSGAESLREVIAFPKTSVGGELMTGSPAEVTPKELLEYHIKVLE